MPDMVLGAEAPNLRVVVQRDATTTFAVTLNRTEGELAGLTAEVVVGIDAGPAAPVVVWPGVRSGSTYTWTVTPADVAKVRHGEAARLVLRSGDVGTVLASGRVEVRA